MKCTISQHKAFKILEWILFIGFSIAAGWFASSVLEQFFSLKTSFSQREEEFRNYPVISLTLFGYKASEVILTNVKVQYFISGMKNSHTTLEIGENYFLNDKYNKTEKVILENLEKFNGKMSFRIIHETPILDKKNPIVVIEITQKIEKTIVEE